MEGANSCETHARKISSPLVPTDLGGLLFVQLFIRSLVHQHATHGAPASEATELKEFFRGSSDGPLAVDHRPTNAKGYGDTHLADELAASSDGRYDLILAPNITRFGRSCEAVREFLGRYSNTGARVLCGDERFDSACGVFSR